MSSECVPVAPAAWISRNLGGLKECHGDTAQLVKIAGFDYSLHSIPASSLRTTEPLP
ncbi:hypothetical protein BRAS3843_2020013 [Bradyrhizobium sp. STM 3843]|nr:hypothetical protein BRAS3843_2020013 [Bradyrhizobium sp. STM 3843]